MPANNLVLAAALALQAAPADAGGSANWVSINENERRVASYDSANLQRTGDLVRFTMRFDFRTPLEGGVSRRSHDTEIDCPRRTVRMLSVVDADADGGLLVTHPVPAAVAVHNPIAPGSPGEAVLAAVCR